MDKKKGFLEKLSWKSIIAAIITVVSFYFGVPEYLFAIRPMLVSKLDSNAVSFIEGAILGAITVVLVLKLYSQITTKKEEWEVEPRVISKTVNFAETLSANEERTIFTVNGKGSFQKLEIQAEGNPASRMILKIDNGVCWDESFEELHRKASKFLRIYRLPFPQSKAICAVDIDLPKNFFKKLVFSVKNLDANSNLMLKGTAHYNIY